MRPHTPTLRPHTAERERSIGAIGKWLLRMGEEVMRTGRQEQSALGQWKARALAAESKLERLRRATAALLKEF